MKASVVARTVFVASPEPGAGVSGGSYYSTADGSRLVSVHSHTSRSDTADVAYVRLSDDDGCTWGEPREWPTRFEHPDGTGRRHPRAGAVDPNTGRYVTFWTEGVLPSDDPLEGMRQWTLRYSVSEDGGRTDLVDEQIIHAGEEYDEIHHLPGVTRGKNAAMLGDLGQRPLVRDDGVILVPIQSSPAGPDGMYHNPGAGYTYTDCLILMGSWQRDGRLSWTASDRVVGDPGRTTRGLIEPTIAQLSDGSLLMVMRGSNDVRHEFPGHKWMAVSRDGGHTWQAPQPWMYDDGEAFHSPSSCSQLIPIADGRLLWMGNITGRNPHGNRPRYPIVLGEVALDTGLLRRDTVTVIDDRQEDDDEQLTLSNFYVREERGSGDLLLHLPRFFAAGTEGPECWTADLSLYRIEVE